MTLFAIDEDDAAKCFDNATTCLNQGSAVVTWVATKKTTYTPTSKVASIMDADGSIVSTTYDMLDRTHTWSPIRSADKIRFDL